MVLSSLLGSSVATVRRVSAFLLSGLALSCSAPGVAAAPAQEIVVAIGSEPTTLDPQIQDDGAVHIVTDNLYETLYVRDAAGKLHPGLASALPRQIDPLTWEVTLREGIRFHNGEPLDAKAVAFSLKRIVDPALKSSQFSYVSTIKDAVAVDAKTVRVTTVQPDPVLTARLYWLKIVPPGAAGKPDFASKPVGTGPYRFVRWDRGQDIVLEANPDYWGAKPQVPRVVFRFIPDASARLAGLLAGEVDLTTNVAPEFAARAPKVEKVEGLELPYIVINSRPGSPTADVRVRQALLYAINKQELADTLFEGNATATTGQLLVPEAFGFDPAIKGYPFDPDKARSLLKEAGAEGATIGLLGPGGRFLKDRDVVEAIAGYWTAIGLKVDLRIPEWSEYQKRIYDPAVRPDVYYSSSGNELFDADRAITAYYHPTGSGASNANTELGQKIEAARYGVDPQKRQALYSEILKFSEEQGYVASLLRVKDIYGLSKRLVWTPRVDGKLFLKDARLAD
ncbi:Oligopeptide ABC transporter, periplasmic oligopeptide-binding protein OppA (TC 3.A.1.5.1) [plant metagenome]|uniref:Oligopeptide ABC transporter, periplasmic oligopeptide-binding protein OppA (TC 3.A.1.5.1) n=1 Tax=plant metagenome TaxID=1297885 RepID=A0A484P6H9_9ZZZZ